MKRIYIELASVGVAIIALAGCDNEGTATAPATTGNPAPATPGTPAPAAQERRKLTVTAPGEQNVTRDIATEFTVSVNRDNFAGPIGIELRSLPVGVSVITKEMTIPAGKDSLTVSIKATPDAPVVDDHLVKVAAKATDMPEAVTDFKLDVRAKN